MAAARPLADGIWIDEGIMADLDGRGFALLAGADGRQRTDRDEEDPYVRDVNAGRPGFGVLGIRETERPAGKVNDDQIGDRIAGVAAITCDRFDTLGD